MLLNFLPRSLEFSMMIQESVGKLSDNQVATTKFVWKHGSHQLSFAIWAFHQWKHLLIHRGAGSIKGLFARALLD